MRLDQWDVFVGLLEPGLGSEQGGIRPLLVVSPNSVNWSLAIATVLPITMRKPGRKVYWTECLLPAGAGGIKQESLVMAHQIRTVSQGRLRQRWGSLDDPGHRAAVNKLLTDYFTAD